MPVEHQHEPGVFDPDHCQDCARETDLLDHYRRVQREELTVSQALELAQHGHGYATWALRSAVFAILLAAIALFTR